MRPTILFTAAVFAVTLAAPAWSRPPAPMQHTHPHQERRDQGPRVPWKSLDQGTRQMLAPLQSRWNQISPHAQQHLMRRAKQWEKLPAYRQKRIRRHIRHWQQMSPAERRHVRTNERIYEQLTPAQRAQLHRAFEEYKQLPEDKKKALREQWHKLTPKQRKQWIRNGAQGDLPESHGR